MDYELTYKTFIDSSSATVSSCFVAFSSCSVAGHLSRHRHHSRPWPCPRTCPARSCALCRRTGWTLRKSRTRGPPIVLRRSPPNAAYTRCWLSWTERAFSSTLRTPSKFWSCWRGEARLVHPPLDNERWRWACISDGILQFNRHFLRPRIWPRTWPKSCLGLWDMSELVVL